jgi:hypothetical protein
MENYFFYIGSVCSILGLGVSIWVLWSVKRLRSHFLIKARVPELTKALASHAKTLSIVLGNYDEGSRDVKTTFKVCESTLKNLEPKLFGSEKIATKSLLKKLSKSQKSLDKEKAWTLYNDLQALIESLKHLQKDSKWSQ